MEMLGRTACRYIRTDRICRPCLRHSCRESPCVNYRLEPISRSCYRNRNRNRSFHSTVWRPQSINVDTQVHPLGDFYADLLAKPIPKESQAKTDLPTFVQSGGDLTKEERAAKLFGNIQGSGYERRTTTPDETWQTINGVPIPPRPLEPENCCMSGCVHCVWDDYRDDIEEWAMRLKEAQAKVTHSGAKQTPKVELPRPEVEVASTSMDDDGGGSESLWTTPSTSTDADELFAGIPVGIREFMNIEKKIRERKREREAKSDAA